MRGRVQPEASGTFQTDPDHERREAGVGGETVKWTKRDSEVEPARSQETE